MKRREFLKAGGAGLAGTMVFAFNWPDNIVRVELQSNSH